MTLFFTYCLLLHYFKIIMIWCLLNVVTNCLRSENQSRCSKCLTTRHRHRVTRMLARHCFGLLKLLPSFFGVDDATWRSVMGLHTQCSWKGLFDWLTPQVHFYTCLSFEEIPYQRVPLPSIRLYENKHVNDKLRSKNKGTTKLRNQLFKKSSGTRQSF